MAAWLEGAEEEGWGGAWVREKRRAESWWCLAARFMRCIGQSSTWERCSVTMHARGMGRGGEWKLGEWAGLCLRAMSRRPLATQRLSLHHNAPPLPTLSSHTRSAHRYAPLATPQPERFDGKQKMATVAAKSVWDHDLLLEEFEAHKIKLVWATKVWK